VTAGATQVSPVGSQVSGYKHPGLAAQGWPTPGNSVQTELWASQEAHPIHAVPPGVQTSPTVGGDVHSEVVESQWSSESSQSFALSAGLQGWPVATGDLQVAVAGSQ
jgi:hypothetical protein